MWVRTLLPEAHSGCLKLGTEFMLILRGLVGPKAAKLERGTGTADKQCRPPLPCLPQTHSFLPLSLPICMSQDSRERADWLPSASFGPISYGLGVACSYPKGMLRNSTFKKKSSEETCWVHRRAKCAAYCQEFPPPPTAGQTKGLRGGCFSLLKPRRNGTLPSSLPFHLLFSHLLELSLLLLLWASPALSCSPQEEGLKEAFKK